MKLGISTPMKYAAALAQAGYDYLETNLSDIAAMPEEEYEKLKQEVSALPVKVESFNVMLPGDHKVVGPTYDHDAIRSYLDGSFARAKELGAKIIVFGSGGAKQIPEDFPREKAMEQLADFVGTLAELAEKYDVIVPIEPLRRSECNCINSVAEAYALMKTSDSPRVRVLADYYHMADGNESVEEIVKVKDVLAHLHIACPGTRFAPNPGDGHDYSAFFDAVKRAGFDARLTFEGNEDKDFVAESTVCLKYMRKLCRDAGISVKGE